MNEHISQKTKKRSLSRNESVLPVRDIINDILQILRKLVQFLLLLLPEKMDLPRCFLADDVQLFLNLLGESFAKNQV
ncbi:hypothetical protein ES703_79198 [subsurface metagenome]